MLRLDHCKTSLPREFSTQSILDAISIILQKNTFQFDDKQFIQPQGTAMGTKMAPTYATLVMGFLEKKLYKLFENQYGRTDAELLSKLFK